jgi:uncharacterized protein YbjT (DUF2867 family)
VRDREAVRSALRGVGTAYYLVHSMGAGGSFEQEDQSAAATFGAAAAECGVRRMIYLGGLGAGSQLSPHLASRQEVGRILRESGVPTIELRASIVIGAGSLSFELLRTLVERLPVMVTPRWAQVRTQPIWIDDVLAYLIAALDASDTIAGVVEIGGQDLLSYRELMLEYAHQRGLRRLIVPVPVLTPHLSSLWLALVTPVYTQVGRELIEGLRNETIVRDPSALDLFPVQPHGIREAIRATLRHEDEAFANKRFARAVQPQAEPKARNGHSFGRHIVETYEAEVEVPPERAFAPIRRIGGATGWYYADGLWSLRGALDRLAGGVGSRRRRTDPEQLKLGDVVDFWRVDAIEPDRLLRLEAEMRLPGHAWLQFEVNGTEGGSAICQTAIFDPRGVAGRLYWYALYPAHRLIFRGMLRGIADAARDGTSRS